MTDTDSLGQEQSGALLGMMLAAVIVPLNSTMIAVALPDISSDLSVSTGTTGVLVVVYLVVMLVGQPIAGRLGDRIGYQRTIAVGLVGVGLASLAASLATVFAALVTARAVQAGFAALLVPNAQAVIRATTAPERRGRVFGLFGSMIGAGAAIGPLVGGAVTAVAGWPAVFLVNIPVVVAALVLIRRVDEPAHQVGGPSAVEPAPAGRIWNRAFSGAFSTQAFTTFGQYTLILVVPLVLDDRGWSAGAIGAAVTALTIGMVVMGPVGGTYGDRHGRRRPAVVGVGVAFVAVAVAALSGDQIMAALLIAVLLAYGFGFGFAAPSLMTAAIESAPVGRTATASGLFSTSRYTGSIPASLAFALIIGESTAGVDSLLIVATACAAAALATASLLPHRPSRHPDGPAYEHTPVASRRPPDETGGSAQGVADR
ncbi:MAG: MFS transporter [Acidimicrobiales bacterium]